MGMGCGGKCGMFFLIVLNTIFLLLGLALMIVGIIMKVDDNSLKKTEVTKMLNEVSFNGNLGLGNVANSLSILIICIGAFVVLVAALGAFGACCKNRCLLVVYAIIVLLVFVAQCVAVGLWFTMKAKVEKEVKTKLEDVLKKYEGTTSTNEVSVGFDLIFLGFKCCGVSSIKSITSNQDEFADTEWWKTKASLEKVPASCCQKATEDNYKTLTDTTCTQALTTHQKTGCYDAFKDWLMKYQTPAIVVGVILLVVEILAVIFAFVICRAIAKKEMMV